MRVSPSILAMDFNNIENETNKINNTDCEFIHLDVMDGKFVPNTTFDYNLIKELKFKQIFDTHLMIEKPLSVLDTYIKISDYVTFHYEAESHNDILDYLKNKKYSRIGLSIKPNTSVFVLEEMLPYLDLVLIMSVEPGFGGQKFMESSLEKIKYLKEQKELNNYNYLIEVDGGINEENAKKVKEAGCEVVVAGTYIFKAENYQSQIDKIR